LGIERVVSTDAFEENTYLLSDLRSKECFIIDPGGAAEEVISLVERSGLKVVKILATHGHIDHVASAPLLTRRFHAPLLIHGDDSWLLESIADQASAFGYGFRGSIKADGFLSEGDLLELGSLRLEVWHTPGHTPGSSCFFVNGEVLFSGDTLFAGSIGRTDFQGGSTTQMAASLKKLMGLPDRVKIYPGHEGESTIGNERESNPFLFFPG
jgi:glyoxylase-like metal-dependent hydrolase (beta-lactamase superfamily II)